MTDWWTTAYRGAPMVGPPLPRPLYPPDAVGYFPSADGPDVVAIKRTVSRLGRWPWQAFDDSYSNGFAHGRSGNVAETGVAGFQRQQRIDPTGYVGSSTYNALRSALIPDGLPHAGEHGMDSRAVALLEEAYALYHSTSPELTVRELALGLALAEVGYKESPPSTNANRYGEWYGMNGQPWCAMFCTWAFEHVAGGSPSFARGSLYAYVPYVVNDARSRRNGLAETGSPIPGDLVCYDWNRDSTFDHIGIVVDGDARSWEAVEGNTSTSSNSNGGEVMLRNRSSSDGAAVFVRVSEP